jgi:hypothetical protein
MLSQKCVVCFLTGYNEINWLADQPTNYVRKFAPVSKHYALGMDE